MDIRYTFPHSEFKVKASDEYKKNLSFLLTNSQGDYLQVPVYNPTCKYQGLVIRERNSAKMFKVIDEISLSNQEPIELSYSSYKGSRKFQGKKVEHMTHTIYNDSSRRDQDFGEEGDLLYDDQGNLVERVKETSTVNAFESFYLGPTGGMVYEVYNHHGEIYLDFDCRELNDFDSWGKKYETKIDGENILIKYTKEGQESYQLYIYMYIEGGLFEETNSWIEKEYSYSKERNSLASFYVNRLLKVSCRGNKRIIIGVGFDETEARDQVNLLKNHQHELEHFDNELNLDLCKENNFDKPLPQRVLHSYNLSSIGMYKFISKNFLTDMRRGSLDAGYGWFSQTWTRDELVGLRAFINRGDIDFVKERLFFYLSNINEETGMLPRIFQEGSLESPDGVFWLAKRFEDLLFYLDENGLLEKNLSHGEIKYAQEKLSASFKNIIQHRWNFEEELLSCKQGESWMDTLEYTFPLDMQVQLLQFSSVLSVLSSMITHQEETDHYLDMEYLLKEKIRSDFLEGNHLVSDKFQRDVTVNVFLAYYFYPNLLDRTEWERVIDSSLNHLNCSWGGLSSLSKKHSDFKEFYSGENNLSYHRGDSWYWMNNVAAIVLNDLNEKKYRNRISEIVSSSTRDILEQGIIGFSSEVSSSAKQLPQGTHAQLWSTTTFIEMVDKVFIKKTKESLM